MSLTEDFVVAIGDSQSRSLSYDANILSLQIGPAAFHNFLTPERAEHTSLKTLELTTRISENKNIVMFFNGDIIHHLRNTFQTATGIIEQEQEALSVAAQRYIALCKEIQNRILGSILVLSVPPNEKEHGDTIKYYNQILERLCREQDLQYLNLWTDIANGDGSLNTSYRDDFIHVNHRISQLVVNRLKELGFISTDRKPLQHQLSYKHKIELQSGEVGIWGDCYFQDLELPLGDTHFWQYYHEKTSKADLLLSTVTSVIGEVHSDIKAQDPSILFLDSHEGYYPIHFSKNAPSIKVSGIDRSVSKTALANEIGGLQQSKANFINSSNYSEVISGANYTSIALLDSLRATDEWKMDIFKSASNAKCKALLLLTRDEKRDKKLLSKAQFSWTGVLPIGVSGKELYSSEKLLLALGDMPSQNWLSKYFERLQVYAETVMQEFQGCLSGMIEAEFSER